MPWVLHKKTTAVMAGSYAALAMLLLYGIRDTTLLAAILVMVFALVLLAGNVYRRAKNSNKAQNARHRAQGAPGERPKREPIPAGAYIAPCALRLDPEAGRR